MHDPDAFAAAVRPHVARLVGLARRFLRSADLAWDAVQEALVTLWHSGALPPDAGRWLVRAVVHRSLHASRTLRRRTAHERGACRDRKEAADRLDPAALADRREIVERVERALRALPRGHRDVLVLRLVDDLDYGTIARRLRIPIGTVRSRLHRGRAALCRLLDCREPHRDADSEEGTREPPAALGS